MAQHQDPNIPTNWATRDSRSTHGLRHEITSVLPIVEGVFQLCSRNQKYQITITGGQEFGHSVFSRHHTGFAVDLRTKDLPGGSSGPVAMQIEKIVQGRLGSNYFVKLERAPDHLHVEFKPGNRVSDPADYSELTGNTKNFT
jgi:hypothetical protein